MKDDTDSILNGIKSLLGGIPPNQKEFDSQLIDYINNTISILSDLGVPEADTFFVSNEKDTWSDFITNKKLLGFVKPFISQKVKLYFDPPQSTMAIEAIQKMIGENEWRITNYYTNSKKGGN